MVEKRVYAITGILTLAIFLVGFLTGYSVLNFQLEQLKIGMDKNELDIRNVQLEMLFLDTLESDDFCSYMSNRLETIHINTAKLGKQLVDSESMNKDHFGLIRRRYSLALIQDWLLSKQFVKRCNSTRLNVLYFFAQECGPCIQQGYILDYLVEKDKTNNINIYSLDKNIDEPVIQALVRNFNITVAPTLVINDVVRAGFNDKKTLIREFCEIDSNLTICEK